MCVVLELRIFISVQGKDEVKKTDHVRKFPEKRRHVRKKGATTLVIYRIALRIYGHVPKIKS